ncbi:MAG: hypothetical protein K2Q06_09610, partial [Parvularculaceae bacterium]|nr:hypothetical protein [Parvularculaceae bacterium]
MTRADPNLVAGALIESYAARGDYVDCFTADVAVPATIDDLVEAFFNCRAFRPERLILKALLGKTPLSPDWRLAPPGEERPSAAWFVEARARDEILFCDFMRYTRCWLRCERRGPQGVRIYFGTAFARRRNASIAALNLFFATVRPAHALYAKA